MVWYIFNLKLTMMKTLNHLSSGFRLMVLVLSTLLISLNGCTKQETDPVGFNELNDINMKSLVMHEGTVNLQGFMRWYVYAKMEHKLIVDPAMMYTLCTAELTFIDEQSFTLHTTEIIPPSLLFREITFEGKMTPGGALKYTWPETWLELQPSGLLEPVPFANAVEQINVHTGYELSGPGVNKGTLNFKGYFNGTKFYADCHVNAFQLVPGPVGTPYEELVSGPILFSMVTELQIVD